MNLERKSRKYIRINGHDSLLDSPDISYHNTVHLHRTDSTHRHFFLCCNNFTKLNDMEIKRPSISLKQTCIKRYITNEVLTKDKRNVGILKSWGFLNK